MNFFRIKNDRNDFLLNLDNVVSISLHDKGPDGHLIIDLETKNVGTNEPWKVPVDEDTQMRFQMLLKRTH